MAAAKKFIDNTEYFKLIPEFEKLTDEEVNNMMITVYKIKETEKIRDEYDKLKNSCNQSIRKRKALLYKFIESKNKNGRKRK